jgi:hypothetical protein
MFVARTSAYILSPTAKENGDVLKLSKGIVHEALETIEACSPLQEVKSVV